MYTFRKSLFALSVLAVWSVAARAAEDEKVIAREDAIEVMLAGQKSVQEDLRMTAEQGQKVHDFAAKQWKKLKDMKNLGKDEQDRGFKAMAKDNYDFLKNTLSASQCKRLNEIAMQQAGLLWVMRSDVATALNLTNDQKDKIRELHREAHKEAVDALRSDNGTVEDQKFRDMRQANHKRLMSVLSEPQKTKWKEMCGTPFRGELHFGPRPEK